MTPFDACKPPTAFITPTYLLAAARAPRMMKGRHKTIGLEPVPLNGIYAGTDIAA